MATMISLYVNNPLIDGNSYQSVVHVKNALCARFETEDCREAEICLRVEISRNRFAQKLNIGQEKYISKVLSRFRIEDFKSAPTLISNQIDEVVHKTKPFNSTTYNLVMRNFMFLMICIRSDIAFAVGRVFRYMRKPTVALWTCMEKVFRIIHGT